jgi:hypothetical protein
MMGTRHNTGKLRYSLLPPNVLLEVIKVLEMGATKYGESNWKKGLPYSEIINSLERHLGQFKLLQDTDEESKLSHIAHLVANGIFLLYFILNDRLDLDDRKDKYL